MTSTVYSRNKALHVDILPVMFINYRPPLEAAGRVLYFYVIFLPTILQCFTHAPLTLRFYMNHSNQRLRQKPTLISKVMTRKAILGG